MLFFSLCVFEIALFHAKTKQIFCALNAAFPMDTWRTDYLDTTGYFYSGSHYVTFCENFISNVAPFVGKQRGFGKKEVACMLLIPCLF